MLNRVKAAFVAILTLFGKGARFFHRKGRVVFQSLSPRWRPILTIFFDVRQKQDGRLWIQLKDRKEERRMQKKVSRSLENE